MSNLIGRKKEIDRFNSFVKGNSSEFVAVYGRRRVGKTFLIREALKDKLCFQMTGYAEATLQEQLLNFNDCIKKTNSNKKTELVTTWQLAFKQLIAALEKTKTKKKVLFIDELPWLDTPKSGFMRALEHFWNSWASARNDIILIVCGSAASWMINKLINNKGGLHNRVTQKLHVQPFTLGETELFLKTKKINWSRYQIIEVYMAMGGIPFYLNALQVGLSATQNIDKLFFENDGLLKQEFSNLYASLFKHAESHVAITEALTKKTKGLTREEIIHSAKIPNGGGTTKVLDELEISGFIRKYNPYEKKKRESLYQLSDFYTLFYYRFIKNNKMAVNHFWANNNDSPSHRAWSGNAFEQVCVMHLPQIKKELGISGIQSYEASWRSKTSKDGAQIDLLIDRKDETINVCEIKFSIKKFTIDKRYAVNLRNKIGTFKDETKTRKAVFLTFITTYGLSNNEYSQELVQNDITLNCLFE